MTWNEFFVKLAEAMIPVVLAFVCALISIARRYLDAAASRHLKEGDALTTQKYTSLVDNTLTNLITASGETIVRELKTAGKWDKDTALTIKTHVLEQANTQLADFRESIEGSLLVDLPKYLSDRLEFVLASLRADGTIRPVTPGGETTAPPQD